MTHLTLDHDANVDQVPIPRIVSHLWPPHAAIVGLRCEATVSRLRGSMDT